MKLHFYGGASEVGRSAIMVRDERSFVFDYGIKIEDNQMDYPIKVPNVDAVLLSHAHLDHSGSVPVIYTEQSVPTFGTEGTLMLSDLLLEDALGIAKKEHRHPRFHKKQLGTMVNRYVRMQYEKPYGFGNYSISMYDAGHICGSAITLVERHNAKENRRIVYTGDFKVQHQYLHSGAKKVKSDVLIIESTYAGREHANRSQLINSFIEMIKETLDNGGTALVPAFAIGRSQEIIAMLYKHGLIEYAYLDGMAKEATKIIMKHPDAISDKELLNNAAEGINWVEDRTQRRRILEEPSIVVTTAGMLNGGPAIEYIKHMNSDSQVFLTGYQVEGTNGRTLLEKGYIVDNGNRIKVGVPVTKFDFSAHAGDADLHEYIRASAPNTVICVHGEAEATREFAAGLRNEGFEAYAPKVGDTIELAD